MSNSSASLSTLPVGHRLTKLRRKISFFLDSDRVLYHPQNTLDVSFQRWDTNGCVYETILFTQHAVAGKFTWPILLLLSVLFALRLGLMMDTPRPIGSEFSWHNKTILSAPRGGAEDINWRRDGMVARSNRNACKIFLLALHFFSKKGHRRSFFHRLGWADAVDSSDFSD